MVTLLFFLLLLFRLHLQEERWRSSRRQYKERRKQKPHKQMQSPHISQQIEEHLPVLWCKKKLFSPRKNTQNKPTNQQQTPVSGAPEHHTHDLKSRPYQ